jgi:hypothetical protein
MIPVRAVLALALAVVLVSCSPKRAAVLLDPTVTSPELLRSLVEENGRKISSATGSGIITFDSPDLAGSAAFESNLKKPDSLLVTFEGPFGIDVGTFFLSKDTYVVYNSLENTVVTGNPHRARIRSIIPFDLTYEQILSAFSGVFPAPANGEELIDYRVEDEQFLLTYRCGVNTCTYAVDPRYLLVTRYEVRDEHGDLLLQASASSFVDDRGISSARRVHIVFPQEHRRLSIAYSSLRLNPEETHFRFTIPENARRLFR